MPANTSANTAAAGTCDVIMPRAFDISRLSYAAPKQLNNGGKTVFINYGSSKCYLQTPEMRAPFGISMWPGENGAPDKYNLDLSFDGMEMREHLKIFFDVLKTVDKQLVSDAMDNSQLWFKKKYPSIDVVEALYNPTIRYSKDKETGDISNRYAPTFKLTLPMADGKFNFPVYGAGRSDINLLELLQSGAGATKGARAQAIVQLTGVWIVGSKFGLSWRVRQLKLALPARLDNTYSFQDTGDEEDQDIDAAAASVAADAGAAASAVPAGTYVEDSPDEFGDN